MSYWEYEIPFEWHDCADLHSPDAFSLKLPCSTATRTGCCSGKSTKRGPTRGSFSSRIAPPRSGRAAENIAYGYDSFEKTLAQWIASAGHRKNLLLHNASRVGVASARSATSRRTYWAMEIAGEHEPPPTAASKRTPAATKRKAPVQSC